LAYALRGFDDIGIVLTHPREQISDGRVVLIRPVEFEETRSTDETGCENSIAFQVVNRALDDA
jgi:hypothetical protein